jgi:DnaK suppressor protein
MEKEQIEYFKKLLIAWRDELLSQANGAVSHLTNDEDSSPDPIDQATFEQGRSYVIRFRDRESRLIRKINDALERIENGFYGICEQCEEEIGIGRLHARPVAALCISCKTRMEDAERIYGS